MEKFFASISDMLHYLLTIELVTLPYHVFMFGVSIMIGYIGALVLIGFPCSIWESFTKKKIKCEDKLTRIATVCFTVIVILRMLYEKVT